MNPNDPLDALRDSYRDVEPPVPTEDALEVDRVISAWLREAYLKIEPPAVSVTARPRSRFGRGLRIAAAALVVVVVLLTWAGWDTPKPVHSQDLGERDTALVNTTSPESTPLSEAASEAPTHQIFATRPRNDGFELKSGPVRLLLVSAVITSEPDFLETER